MRRIGQTPGVFWQEHSGLFFGSGGGGSGGGTTVQKTEPFDEAKPYILDLMSKAKTAQEQVPGGIYEGQRIAPRTAEEEAALSQVRSILPRLQGAGGSSLDVGLRTARGDFLNPNASPELANVLDSITSRSTQAFTQNVLPQIQASAAAQGAYGGSVEQQQLARATDEFGAGLNSALGDIVLSNYQTERQRQIEAPQLINQAAQLELLAPQLQASLGEADRAELQALIDSEMAKFNELQAAPFAGLGEYASLIGQGSSGYSTGTTIAPRVSRTSGIISGALGGAMLGAGLQGSSLVTGVGATGPTLAPLSFLGGPAGIAGAAAVGGLLGGWL